MKLVGIHILSVVIAFLLALVVSMVALRLFMKPEHFFTWKYVDYSIWAIFTPLFYVLLSKIRDGRTGSAILSLLLIGAVILLAVDLWIFVNLPK